MTAIELDSVTKRFEDVTAVDGISLAVEPGEFLVLVGPSGCGKSTTLRMIAGLETVSDGSLEIGGERVNGVEPKDRDVAMVFQNYALFPHMTAERNMTFGADAARDISESELSKRAAEGAEMLGIEDLLDRKPAALSGGERQRVAIGRALVREPSVFLMDEPLSNLDAKLRIQMRTELASLHRRLQTTTVYVTHDQTEAMTLGDRVAVMNDGHAEQVAPPQELYDRPATRFVAEFIGEPAMNVFPVEVRGDAVVHDTGLEVPIAAGEMALKGDIDAADLGVRPEDIDIAPLDDASAGTCTATAEVTVTEPLGDSLLVHCQLGDETVQVSTTPRAAFDPGERVVLTVDADRSHLFDRETGEAVYHAPNTAVGSSEDRTQRADAVAPGAGGEEIQ
ncbi:glycerol-3-phosphate ABC-type transporter ATP-binding protein [Haloferax elongans ATCC BAA-1513]|uniref:ABC-type D-xylose/L-arabinose transporter n=1 Tax=Haloferax elongans ATCC BAA-1513 TaxID=1230453 RepID=M0HH99_HALEO|nr:ABC transporter ATP-binding protein [Haloferax elongans]ELZ82459.1 glycerol-3-phosphate ABC-type transporter ATP-binding protein [Haloferax elongans ATCC BAA-1513]